MEAFNIWRFRLGTTNVVSETLGGFKQIELIVDQMDQMIINNVKDLVGLQVYNEVGQ